MHTILFRESNVDAGLFRVEPNRFSRAVRLRPSVISVTPCFDAERAEVVHFIERNYSDHYNAQITVEYPNLISLRRVGGAVVAAAGFRFAGSDRLFLEQYTGAPIESLLDTPRRSIVEIGNLASSGGGASLFLFMALASYLNTVCATYAVITCTASLERRLSRLGLEPRRICAADPDRLDARGNAWGSYYDRQPYVMSSDLDLAYKRVLSLFGKDFFRHRPSLLPRLHANSDCA